MLNIFVDAANSGVVSNPLSAGDAMQFLKSMLGAIMYMSIPVIGLVLVYAGFMFITSRGNPEKIKTATNNMGYIVAGIALVLGSYALGSIAYNTVIVGILGWGSL